MNVTQVVPDVTVIVESVAKVQYGSVGQEFIPGPGDFDGNAASWSIGPSAEVFAVGFAGLQVVVDVAGLGDEEGWEETVVFDPDVAQGISEGQNGQNGRDCK